MASQSVQEDAARLRNVKIVHTVVWAFFAGCIFAIPICAWSNLLTAAAVFIVVVLVEVLILAFNGMRCPLTGVAAQFTEDRRDNFDIYLPEWIARHNKLIFGTLYVLGILATFARWKHIV